MINNYLIAALRSLRHEKSNTMINLAGLTLGITGSLILFLFIRDGSSYDRYHEESERIYRLVSKGKGTYGETFTQGVPTPLPEAFKNDFPEAEEVVFTSYRRGNLVAVAQPNGEFKKFEEPEGLVFTQPSFFRVFDRPVIDLMLSYATVKREMEGSGWGSIADADNCYFLLQENVSINSIEDGIPAFVRKYYGEDAQQKEGKSHIIQPLKTLHSDMRFGNYNSKMPKEAKIAFLVIGIFLLVTCCINFINLTTAGAIKRTKEIGVRKVLGASVESILLLFSKEFVKLILIGFLLAGPAAGWVMHKILQQFAYKITLGPTIFLTGVGITLLIAFLTVGFRSIRAALVNPVESLRSE